jgi:quinol monooxygenase YgiN
MAFATFFEWQVLPGKEEEFARQWEVVTLALRAEGSHGSALFRGDGGTYYAFARWPDRATRDAAFAKNIVPAATEAMRACIADSRQRIDMDEQLNHWSNDQS